ncbi:MAG: universal stress protein [Alphaproteobacteria bacterium]
MVDYSTILVSLGCSSDNKIVLNTAQLIAEQFFSHIYAVNVKPDPVINFPYYGEGVAATIIPEMVSVTEKIGAEKSKTSKKAFNDFCQKNNIKVIDFEKDDFKNNSQITASYAEKIGAENDILADLAKIFHITVSPCPREHKTNSALTNIDAVLVDGGAITIAVPDKKISSIGKRIAIAWNGGAASARALKNALPFLKKAEDTLLIVPEKAIDLKISLNELLKSLEIDGIYPKVEEISENFISASSCILEKAEKFNADLLVMGAYTNSSLRRLILGGITKNMLLNTKIPLFLCH